MLWKRPCDASPRHRTANSPTFTSATKPADAVDYLRRAKTRLRGLKLPDAAHNRVLEDSITTVDFHVARIARELVGFVWELATRFEAQQTQP